MNMEQDNRADASRRSFLGRCSQALIGATVVGTVGPLLAACEISVVRGGGDLPTRFDVSALTADNQALVTTTNGPEGAPLLIVRKSATEYVALSMLCTHLGCTINAPVDQVATCPCHGSQFDLSGRVLVGPAPRNLARYATTYDAGSRTVEVAFS